MAEELALLCQSLAANLVIADDELSASQIRNLEEILGSRSLTGQLLSLIYLLEGLFLERASSR